jgi:hypothetical protein
VALIVVGFVVWAGSTLLLDAWWKRQTTDLADRLMPYQSGSVAEEAQCGWIDKLSRDDLGQDRITRVFDYGSVSGTVGDQPVAPVHRHASGQVGRIPEAGDRFGPSSVVRVVVRTGSGASVNFSVATKVQGWTQAETKSTLPQLRRAAASTEPGVTQAAP